MKRLLAGLLGLTLLHASPTFGQEAEFIVPQVIYEAPVIYPEQERATGQQAQVRLQLDIGENGQVLNVEVLDSPSDAFSEAAIEAIRSTKFSAATLDGEPIGSTIEYVLNFTLELTPALSVEGLVREAGLRTPLENATIELVNAEGEIAFAKTDEEGKFQIFDLAPGEWSVSVSGAGLRAESADVTVEDGKASVLEFFVVRERIWEESDEYSEVIEVITQEIKPEVNERVISTQQAMSLPGTNGDVVRAVQNFPGVARPPLGIGQLIIRGTAPEDSAYYLDGMQIPLVFHFGGLSTVINGDSLSDIGFLSGNYGVRYGNTLGGVVDLKTKASLPPRSRGYVSVDVYQAAVFVEQKVSKRTAITFSGRRSYIDAVLTPILSSGSMRFQAPRYYDLQARVLHRTERGDRLDFFLLFSDDRFAALNDEGEAQIGLTTQFLKGRFLWRAPLENGWANEFDVLVGPDKQEFVFSGDGEAYERQIAINVRNELTKSLEEGVNGVGWRFGLDLQTAPFDFKYDVPGFGETEQGDGWLVRPALYAENTFRKGIFESIFGVRGAINQVGADSFGWTVDPRLLLSFRAGATTRIIGTVGRYSQFALPRELLGESDGNPDLIAQWSFQTSLGIRQRLPLGMSLEVSGFYNRLYKLVSGREDRFEFFTGPPPAGPFDTDPYANDGVGEIYGGELLYRLESKRALAQLSFTYARSFRTDRPGDEVEVFRYDQPVTFNALATYELPKRWRIGGRVRVGSGNPYSPVVNRVQNVQNHSFIPIYKPGNFDRLPTFWSIDVRVDKDWVFKKWTLTLYLDIQNVTNNTNPEVIGYTYDYAAEDPIAGLPILPAFGLKGAW